MVIYAQWDQMFQLLLVDRMSAQQTTTAELVSYTNAPLQNTPIHLLVQIGIQTIVLSALQGYFALRMERHKLCAQLGRIVSTIHSYHVPQEITAQQDRLLHYNV